jgi:xanthine dehydrogenase accessory factor
MNIYTQITELIKKEAEFSVVKEYTSAGVSRKIVRDTTIECEFEQPAFDHATLAEFYAPKPRLIVFGGGHIAIPVCKIGALIGFDVIVYDDRPAFAHAERFPEAAEVICDGFDKVSDRIKFTERDYVVIVTRGHKHDGDCLRCVFASEKTPFYMGMIGSRRRVAIVRKQVADEGYDAAKLERLHSPIGLSIGAVTPEEIAVSILGEIIEVKRRADGRGHYHGTFSVDAEIAEKIAESSEPCALITIVASDGSTPREEGAQMAAWLDGTTVGTIGGGCAEADVARFSRQVINNDPCWAIYEVDMTDAAEEDGMVCGGTMQILVEKI